MNQWSKDISSSIQHQSLVKNSYFVLATSRFLENISRMIQKIIFLNTFIKNSLDPGRMNAKPHKQRAWGIKVSKAESSKKHSLNITLVKLLTLNAFKDQS